MGIRFFTALSQSLPAELLVPLLEPMISPLYRCTTAYHGGAASTLPDVQSLEQALSLTTKQRLEFVGQLSQMGIDALTAKMGTPEMSAKLTHALAKVRKAVERRRAERAQKRRVQPIVDPHAAARTKRAKNLRKQAGKKTQT